MPRTKGATNKPKSVEYHLHQLDKLGYKFSENSTESNNLISEEKHDLVIEKPREMKKEETIYKCGFCGKTLESDLNFCPYCSSGLKW